MIQIDVAFSVESFIVFDVGTQSIQVILIRNESTDEQYNITTIS